MSETTGNAKRKQQVRELFDFETTYQKALATINKLGSMEPSQIRGQVGKNDVLFALKSELLALSKKGWSNQMIAKALQEDEVFDVLPKTLTQIMGNKPKSKPITKKRSDSTVSPTELGQTEAEKVVDAARTK